jgi:polar amino acid transport system substrate-binding protein
MFKLLLPLLIVLNLSTAAQAQSVTLITADYPPFSYRQDNELKGAIVDEVRQMMEGLGEYTITMMPWARAYAQAQTAKMTCAIGTAHTPERDSLFRWVQPLMIDRNILIKHKGSAVSAMTLDEAKRYSVGTWREDYTETLLRKLDFPKIDVASDITATMRKLMNDRIDLMPMAELYYLKLVKDGQPVERVANLTEQPIGIACQKDFPEPLRRKMQTALDDMIADGTQKQIFLQYDMPLEN